MGISVYELLSIIFSAPFIALYTIIRLLPSNELTFIDFSILLIGLAIIPLIIPLYTAYRKGYEWDYPARETRIKPFSLVVLNYFIALIILYLIGSSNTVLFLITSYFLNGLVSLIISLKHKISLHMIGIIGPATYLLLIGFLMDSTILYILSIIVAYSRYILKRHSIEQIIMGVISGFILTIIAYMIIYGKIPLEVFIDCIIQK
jgi:membrane-associated phospholipid phosphatase